MLKVTAMEYILDFYPGALRFYFTDAYGTQQTLVEKLPVLGLDHPEDATNLPFDFEIPFKLVKKIDGKISKVKLDFGISDEYGNSEFYIICD
ncbi:MAG: hypothetical protein NXH86_01120 [Flavobacteriaceae bacterium]|jgi:hypothetical protein|uniref:hypothetical protein n=1 Tax=Flagellimonas sp. SN16 TaxID=3415142 RepID=UPI003C3D00EA|nr:hypothetical protein [Flavobacteriaceae bacterium]